MRADPTRRRAKTASATAAALALVAGSLILGSAAVHAETNQTPNQVTIQAAGTTAWADSGNLNYPRVIQLAHSGSQNGSLISTFEQKAANGARTFPIYRSSDQGVTWTKLSEVADTQNGWGLWWNPDIYELPSAVGSMPAGTLLISGESVTSNYSAMKLVLYASTDGGVTWSFKSNIMSISIASDFRAIWEPHLRVISPGVLTVFYSDDKSEASTNNQMLVRRTTTDGLTWTAYDKIVASGPVARPGMASVAKMGNGQWIMTYECIGCGAPRFRISNDGINWGNPADLGTPIVTPNGDGPGGAPYVSWTPGGGPNGTITVSSWGNSTYNYVNYNYGVGIWQPQANPLNVTFSDFNNGREAYSHATIASADGTKLFHISSQHSYTDGSGHRFNDIRFASTPTAVKKIVGTQSGRCLDLNAYSTADGASIDIWDCVAQTNESWIFDTNSQITSTFSGKCLDLSGGSTADGTYVVQNLCSGSTSQKWTYNASTNQIVSQASGKCLNVNGAATGNGSRVIIWPCVGAPNEKWGVNSAN